MAAALRLARKGLYTAHPNPRVGCVPVNSGNVVGSGWHRRTGEAHAEANALDMAGDKAKGSIAYVTLEPCSHEGRTPPCANALVEAGVARVIAAMSDPNPKVSGSGFDLLRSSGIDVDTGLMQAEAEEINRGFVSRLKRGRPFVRLKIASSLDGRTAMASGESQWITGDAARRDVQRLRAQSGAIMTGAGTVLADDPALTVRDESIDNDGLQPVRVVLDTRLKLPATARMLPLPGQTAMFCIDDQHRTALENAGADIHLVAASDGQVDLHAVMQTLSTMEINDVLVESGPALAGSLLSEGLVDELVIYQAPHMMGSETRGMVTTPAWQALAQRQALEIVDVRMLGADIRVTARPAE
jgi:diaminohydroxyphosphoribosylaminopyrimidine deaminase/5-amino-6-(5-phosphoribosylamino)uracil reductase